jgi:hypothetical protein
MIRLMSPYSEGGLMPKIVTIIAIKRKTRKERRQGRFFRKNELFSHRSFQKNKN